MERAGNDTPDPPPLKDGDAFEAELQNFKDILNKIRDIMDGICAQNQQMQPRNMQKIQLSKTNLNTKLASISDSYSENSDLSTAAKRLEDALDSIIRVEEQKRTKS